MEQKTYRTSEAARLIGVHPNTVRLYEDLKLISPPKRRANGYRVFTDLHLEQLRLARTALQVEVLQNGLRKQAVEIIKTAAAGDLVKAKVLTKAYLQAIFREQNNAEEAIKSVRELLSGAQPTDHAPLRRREAAEYLGISMDTLRSWELNGLLSVKRRQNGYRVYTAEDLLRLKIIRSLRCANYSLSAILRLLGALSLDPNADIRTAIDTPDQGDDIIAVCDKLLTSLARAGENARMMYARLEKMEHLF